MKLETADQFSGSRGMTSREARTFRAAMKLGDRKCEACSQPATAMSGGRFFCKLDAQVYRQRQQRATMRAR